MRRINQIILDLRVKNGFTQAQMAEYLALDTSGYGKLERGVTDITLTKLEKIADCFNMSVIDLLAYPDRYVPVNEAVKAEEEEKVSLMIELKKEKKDRVLRLVFGDNSLEILN